MKKAWSILPDEWKPILKERGMRAFRADQILQALYRDYITDWDQATTLPKDFREQLKTEFPITKTKTLEVSKSSDGTQKLLIGLEDGESVETVLIPATGRFTQCISTQVGCGMGCAFCASGARGVVRSLTADEIVAEYMAGRALGEITNIVVMGMGEPFANYDETMRALKLINAGRGPNLGARHITLSTCGVVPGFAKLAAEGIQFELSVSLHAPNDALRDELMPVNKKWPIDELLAACADYTKAGEARSYGESEPHPPFARLAPPRLQDARREDDADVPRRPDEEPRADDAAPLARQGRRRRLRPASPPPPRRLSAISSRED